MPSNIRLKNLLKNAIEEFYSNDNELIAVKGMEQACVFRIGLYLYNLMQRDNKLSQFDLDCEYNKSNKGTKILDDVKVRPDLIIHKRNLNNDIPNQKNTLVVEFKGWWNNNLNDINKLKKFTDERYNYLYPLAVWVKLGKTSNETIFRYFKDGQEVEKNDL